MKLDKSLVAVVTVSVLFAMLSGCQKPEGPAERAGKAIDNVTEKAGQQLEKAGENIQNAAKSDK